MIIKVSLELNAPNDSSIDSSNQQKDISARQGFKKKMCVAEAPLAF